MKQIMGSRILRKVLMLLLLIAGLVFVAGSDRFTQPASAASVCCGSCEVPPEGDYDSYCTNLCSAPSGTCYDDCSYRVHHCWQFCHECFSPVTCGGGGSNSGGWDDFCWSYGYNYCDGNECKNY